MQPRQSDGAIRPLLTTKLHIPQARRDLVLRPHLFAQLNQGLSRKLTLISAPAGFGKTTLVSQWIAEYGIRNVECGMPETTLRTPHSECRTQFAWVSLDSGDNDPVRFWRYVITACQAFEPIVGQSALALIQSAQQPSWELVLTLFINDLAQLSGKGVLVLEDYHVITAPQIHELVLFLLDHLPATLHLIMTTRSDPPLPLARLRAQPDLHELRAADLRFSLAETQAFLQHALTRPLAAELIERLAARTEGWVTGLRLVALTLQGAPRGYPPPGAEPQALEELLATFTGSHGHIFAYLSAEVLHAQPASLQDFLLRTSVPGALGARLTGSLCDALTGRADSELILEQLEQANMFLIPLDAWQQGPEGAPALSGNAHQLKWYRYHALFAEAMQHEAQRQLGEEQLAALLHTASLWYAQHGLLTEAIEAALTAQDFALAADLVQRIIELGSVRYEVHTLCRWLEQLPEALLHTHPLCAFTYAQMILFTSDRRSSATATLVQRPLEIAEQHWQAEENDRENEHKLGEVLAFRALVAWLQGDQSQAFTVAKQALARLPDDEMQWRGVNLFIVGVEALQAGQLPVARQTLTEALALHQAAGNFYGIFDTTLLLGEVCAGQGELQQAAQLYRQVLSEAEQAPMDRDQALIRSGGAQLGLAGLALEWNDLETAAQHATRAVAIGQQVAYDDLRVRGLLLLARVKQGRGETTAAQHLLHELLAKPPQRRWLFLLREVRMYQARLALEAGDLATVERFITATQPGGDVGALWPRLQQEQEALLVSRLRIAQGQFAGALLLLEPWQDEAHGQGRTHSELQIRVLQSLAYFANQALPQAKATLRQALAHAQTEGYQRLFLDEGEAMATLLRLVWPSVKEEPLVSYVRALLLAFVQEQPAGTMRLHFEPAASLDPEAAFLSEPLSPQERRVLHLLAVGLSNAEIAQELVVSINTVKTQVQSIYRKLNVNSRQAAGDAARHLNLP